MTGTSDRLPTILAESLAENVYSLHTFYFTLYCPAAWRGTFCTLYTLYKV